MIARSFLRRIIILVIGLTQDSSDSWADVKPQPPVTESSSVANAGDELRYDVNYVLGSEAYRQLSGGSTVTVPLSLEHGTTYVARLRYRNTHGWSEWSEEIVFSGTYAMPQLSCVVL